MTNYPYILFNKSPEQLRQIGARGGKAQARNRRQRLLAQAAPVPPPGAVVDPVAETAATAIATLDAQFPWLRGAEQRTVPVPPQRSSGPRGCDLDLRSASHTLPTRIGSGASCRSAPDCARRLPYGHNGRSDGFLRRSLSAGEVLWTVPDRVLTKRL